MKATHSGTCQVCGREQKLPNGKLSKHGYSVDWGCFTGVCWGAESKPFEESKDLIEQAIAQAIENAQQKRKEAAWALENKGPEIWYRHYKSTIGYYWAKAKLVSAYEVEIDGKVQRHHFYGGEALRQANESYANHLESQAKQLDQYVNWQKERIKGWKPNPAGLKPVAPESNEPKRHLAGGWAGVWCAASMCGAQKKMYRTNKIEECTCEKCLRDKTAHDARQAAKAAQSNARPIKA